MIPHFVQASLGCFKTLGLFGSFLFLSGCQIGYLANNAYHQVSILRQREPMQDVLASDKLNENQRRKLILAQEARQFAEDNLSLSASDNYTSFVQLKDDYVTYVVNASDKWNLTSHLWWFPIVGHVPYKGYFDQSGALQEQERLRKKGFDTYVRGVAAYSTLGWFKDPILSSMLRYRDHHLVNTIIHETVHTTLYIKSSADFNERMAVFLANKGTEMFYRKLEGDDSATLKLIETENADDKLFSQFITKEIADLKDWYKKQTEQDDEDLRQKRIREIQSRFKEEIIPQMQTQSYHYFADTELNNARLMLFNTYIADLSDFERLFQVVGHDFNEFIASCKELEQSKNPEEDLKRVINNQIAKRTR